MCVLFIPSCLSLSPRIVSPDSPLGPPAPHWTHGGAVSTLKNIPHPNPYMLEQEFSTPHQQTPRKIDIERMHNQIYIFNGQDLKYMYCNSVNDRHSYCG